MKPEILQLTPAAPEVEAALATAYETHRLMDAADPGALLASVGPRIRGVFTMGNVGCPDDVLSALPALEIVAFNSVGYDLLDLDACRARGVRVANTPDVLNDAVAELTFGLMIALCRRLVEADAYVRRGDWAQNGEFPLTAELTGARLGVLGLGRIGKEIARRAQAFKMRVAYHGRREQPHEPYEYYADLDAMARDVDWLVVIAPGSASTAGMVSRAVMTALGPSGRLVNVARGSLVDEAAMVELLREGALGGAALDVFADEPRPHPWLLTAPNVVLSPHAGSATTKTRVAMGELALANLAAHFAGDPLPSPVL